MIGPSYGVQSPSFILYSISNWSSAVSNSMLAFPPLHVMFPFWLTVPYIAFIVIALETVSVLLPALSTVNTCR